MSDYLPFAAAIVGLVALVCVAVAVPMYYFDRKACSNRAAEMQLEWKYKLVGGCFVGLPSGRYVNLSNIRITEQGRIFVDP